MPEVGADRHHLRFRELIDALRRSPRRRRRPPCSSPSDDLQRHRLAGPARAQNDLRVALEQREADVLAARPCRRTRAARGRTRRPARRRSSEDLLRRSRRCRVARLPSVNQAKSILRVTKKSTAITATEPATTDDRRRLADARGAAGRPQTDVARDRHDDEPEHERLDDAHPDVLHVERPC